MLREPADPSKESEGDQICSAAADSAVSDDEASSEGETPDVHAFGDETMIDDGLTDANLQKSIIDVAPGEGQHPLCL